MTQVEIAGFDRAEPRHRLQHGPGARHRPARSSSTRASATAAAPSSSRWPPATRLLAAIAFGDRDVRVAIGTGPRDIVGPAAHAAAGRPRGRRGDGARLPAAARPRREGRQDDGRRRGPSGSASRPRSTASRGQVGSESILPGWRGVAVAEEMAGRIQRPGRRRQHLQPRGPRRAAGAVRCRASSTAVYIKLSYGVGAGLILDGEVFRGAAGTAGEIGHLTIDENGPVCRCGNRGCLETYIGSRGLLDALASSHGPLSLRDVITPGPRRRPRAADACSRTPVATSASPSPAWSTCSTPRSSCSADSCPRWGSIITEPAARVPRAVRHPERRGVGRGRAPGELDTDADVVGALVCAAALPAGQRSRSGHCSVHFLNSTLDVKGQAALNSSERPHQRGCRR